VFPYVNTSTRLVLTEDGVQLEIVRMFDSEGLETENAKEAISCVVGPDPDGMWYTLFYPHFTTIH
jgi:hypothetical protein